MALGAGTVKVMRDESLLTMILISERVKGMLEIVIR
jgi:hypothetical protein